MTFLIRFFALAGLSIFLGLGTAWHMIDTGSFLTTNTLGPWVNWGNEGRIDADPYTRARMARSGRLPITASTALYFTASQDSDGGALSSDCDYEIAGRPFNALWWSVAAYDGDGGLIPNKAGRHAFNSQNIGLLPDGTFRIRMAPEARPGNWLPSAGASGPILVLRVIRPLNAAEAGSASPKAEILPQIKRLEC